MGFTVMSAVVFLLIIVSGIILLTAGLWERKPFIAVVGTILLLIPIAYYMLLLTFVSYM